VTVPPVIVGTARVPSGVHHHRLARGTRRPAFKDIWQTNCDPQGGEEHHAPEPFISNVPPLTSGPPVHSIDASVKHDGSHTVTNEHNNYSKTYEAGK
jgi:hypothetical protein